MSAGEARTVVQALSAVMADVQAVRKGDRNEAQGFNFRGIDAVINAVGPALRKHGVIVLPDLRDTRYGTVEVGSGDRRRPIAHVVVTVAYRFVGPAGDELVAVVAGEAMDSGDKAIPKALSVAFRVALLQALAIPTDEADPDATVYERAPAAEQSRPPADMVGMVLAEAARADVDEPTARELARSRHGGTELEQLDRDQLRTEWTTWHDLGAHPATSTAEAKPEPPPDEPAPITRAQTAKLHAQLRALRVTDRDAKIHAVSAIIGRQVASTADLTRDDATAVIDTLEQLFTGDDPPAALAAIVMSDTDPAGDGGP